MRLAMLCLVVATVWLGGCSGSTSAADCAVDIRYQDAVYRESGFTKEVGSEIGTADLADCDDTGTDAKGSFFREEAKQVPVWSIPGRSSVDAVAIAYEDDTYRVMEVVASK